MHPKIEKLINKSKDIGKTSGKTLTGQKPDGIEIYNKNLITNSDIKKKNGDQTPNSNIGMFSKG